MNVRELEHLLWRYEYGRLGEGRLELELQDGLRRLHDARALQGNPAAADRWSARELLVHRDGAIRAAAQAIDTRRWHEAVRALRRGGEALLAVDTLLVAAQNMENAIEAVESLQQLAGTAFLCALPAIASLTQTTESIRGCMHAADFRAASYLAGICTRMAEPLRERRAIAAIGRRDAEQRLAVVIEIYGATGIVANAAEPDPAGDGSLDRLRQLFDSDQTALAVRLLTEIEIALLGRRRFRLHFGDQLRAADASALKDLVARYSWHGAVDHDSYEALARQAITLIAHAKRAQSATANLDAAFH
jgi:hypothetical protein